ncbi:MAG: class I SAM-dependent methyltransferase [Lentisphaerae bacterium]|nr:class I SAM-dependent methyltransferase [Lentisphaerota bacterium]
MKVFNWLNSRLTLLADPEGMHRAILRRAIVQALRQWDAVHFGKALDSGCGSRDYGGDISRVAEKSIGLDIVANPKADIVVGPVEGVPLPDGSIDLVTTFQVLEHVEDPASYLQELARVCKNGGVLLLSVPSAWPFHPTPSDYRRWMLPGLVHDLRQAGFEVKEHQFVLNPLSTSLQYFLSVCRGRGNSVTPLRRFWITLLAFLVNPLILLSEAFLSGKWPDDGGNILVQAERIRGQ